VSTAVSGLDPGTTVSYPNNQKLQNKLQLAIMHVTSFIDGGMAGA
jgi:hypothetical protein